MNEIEQGKSSQGSNTARDSILATKNEKKFEEVE